MTGRLNPGGFLVAAIGFGLTRFTVTLTLFDTPAQFYLAGVVPLALGLGLAAFGVALAVADVDPEFVRTVAAWCVAGTLGISAMVGLTLLGAAAAGPMDEAAVSADAALSNVLIGGAVGGTLTGLYAARHRRQRDRLRLQTHRLEVLNRLLRHEVLNAVTVIRGYSSLPAESDVDAGQVIEDHSRSIERTIEEVKYLTRSVTNETGADTLDVVACVENGVASVTAAHPEATVETTLPDGDLPVRATGHVEEAVRHLLENAVVHGSTEGPHARVSVTRTPTSARVTVSDDGPGLPPAQRELLETGEITEFDDPDAGFGLNIVRLLVESEGGRIETGSGDGGATIHLVLPLAEPTAVGVTQTEAGLAGVRPAVPSLSVTFLAGLFAGVPFGVVAEALGGSVASIGVFYGITDPVVGWLTHEFHSVVFAFMFAAILAIAPARFRDSVSLSALLGLGWGVVLWVVAAGVIAPLWLSLLGIPASIPTLSTTQFATHVTWGLTLGVVAALGNRYVAGASWRRRE
jgi:signal transduction histidine kinase